MSGLVCENGNIAVLESKLKNIGNKIDEVQKEVCILTPDASDDDEGPIPETLKVGMTLEVIDKTCPSRTKIATIEKLPGGGRISVKYTTVWRWPTCSRHPHSVVELRIQIKLIKQRHPHPQDRRDLSHKPATFLTQ